MPQHVVVMSFDDRQLFIEWRFWDSSPLGEPSCQLMEEPRPPITAAADHDAVRPRLREGEIRSLQRVDVAVDNDRYGYGFFDLSNKRPIGRSRVKLTARAAMHGYH